MGQDLAMIRRPEVCPGQRLDGEAREAGAVPDLGFITRAGRAGLNRLRKNAWECHPEESAILIGGRGRISVVR
jgi:hypothetical protein